MILERLNDWARRTPARTALIHNDSPFSYAELTRMTEAARRAIAAQSPPAGGLALVLSHSLLNAWVLANAARACGLTTVPVSSLAIARELNLSNALCLVRADDEPGLVGAEPSPRGLSEIVVPAPATGASPWLDATANLIEIGPSPGGHVLYTSGTTGAYKKLVFDAAGEDARAKVRAATTSFSPTTAYHALDFGLWTGVGYKIPVAAWTEGGCVIIDQTRSAYANFRRYDPTYAQTLPDNVKAIIDASSPDASPSQRLRLQVSGGFTPLALAVSAVARVSTTVVVGFVASELPTIMLQSQFRSAEDLLWLTPIDPEATAIVDEDGAELSDDDEGELRFRLSDADTKEYLDDPEATARAFRDGWYYTGDLAVRRADGRIRVLGRAGDVLNIKGRKLPAAPIERSIQEGLGVEEVCLLLGMGTDGVEELVVAVRSASPLDRADVLHRLGPSKIFDRVRVEVFTEFPRTSAGTAKTRRTELRRMVFPARTAGV